MALILIVEDDQDVCETYLDILESEQHTVYAVADSVQAIDLLVRKRMKPDLVILDMNLAGESGLVVLGLIRRIPRLNNTKVIIASGYPDLAKKAIDDWGANLFLQKPVAMDTLKDTARHFENL
ncbi:MAG: response regulator [Anaerolineae bacterium]|nr:response regulator [Anaerolineae bacterium]